MNRRSSVKVVVDELTKSIIEPEANNKLEYVENDSEEDEKRE